MPEISPASVPSEGRINRKLDEAGLSQHRLRQGRAEVAVQLDWAGRRRGVRAGLGHRPAAGARRRARDDVRGPGAAEQPLPPPGPLLEIRRGETGASRSVSSEMYHNLPPDMRSRYANCPAGGRRPSAPTTRSSPPRRRSSPDRWRTGWTGCSKAMCACCTRRSTHREYLKSLNPDQVRSEVAQSRKVAGQRAAQGAGDQPAGASRFSANAWRNSRRSRRTAR